MTRKSDVEIHADPSEVDSILCSNSCPACEKWFRESIAAWRENPAQKVNHNLLALILRRIGQHLEFLLEDMLDQINASDDDNEAFEWNTKKVEESLVSLPFFEEAIDMATYMCRQITEAPLLPLRLNIYAHLRRISNTYQDLKVFESADKIMDYLHVYYDSIADMTNNIKLMGLQVEGLHSLAPLSWMSGTDIALAFGISKSTVTKLCNNGTFDAIGSPRRIDANSVARWKIEKDNMALSD